MVLIGETLDQVWTNLLAAVQSETLSRPKLFSVVVLLVLGFVGGRIVAEVVRTLLQMTALDDIAVKTDVQSYLRKLSYRGALSDLLADIVKWLIYLLSLFAVFYVFGFRFVTDYSAVIIAWSTRAATAGLVVVLAAFLADYLEHVTARLFRAGRLSGRMDEAGAEIPVYVLAGKAVKSIVIAAAFLAALGIMGVDTVILNILVALFGLGIVAALVLGARDITRNVALSIYFQLSRVFRGGDRVTIGSLEGEIVGIRPLYTKIKSDGQTYYVPNTRIASETIEKGE